MSSGEGKDGVSGQEAGEGLVREGLKRPSSADATAEGHGVVQPSKRAPWCGQVAEESLRQRAARRAEQRAAIDLLVPVVKGEIDSLARAIRANEASNIEFTYDDHVDFERRFVRSNCPNLTSLLYQAVGLPLADIDLSGTAVSTEQRHKRDKVSSIALQLMSAASKRNPGSLAKLLSREVRKTGASTAPAMLSSLGLLKSQRQFAADGRDDISASDDAMEKGPTACLQRESAVLCLYDQRTRFKAAKLAEGQPFDVVQISSSLTAPEATVTAKEPLTETGIPTSAPSEPLSVRQTATEAGDEGNERAWTAKVRGSHYSLEQIRHYDRQRQVIIVKWTGSGKLSQIPVRACTPLLVKAIESAPPSRLPLVRPGARGANDAVEPEASAQASSAEQDDFKLQDVSVTLSGPEAGASWIIAQVAVVCMKRLRLPAVPAEIFRKLVIHGLCNLSPT